jgi:hypothetical protein
MRTLQSESAIARAHQNMCDVFTERLNTASPQIQLGSFLALISSEAWGFARSVTPVIAGSLDMCA